MPCDWEGKRRSGVALDWVTDISCSPSTDWAPVYALYWSMNFTFALMTIFRVNVLAGCPLNNLTMDSGAKFYRPDALPHSNLRVHLFCINYDWWEGKAHQSPLHWLHDDSAQGWHTNKQAIATYYCISVTSMCRESENANLTIYLFHYKIIHGVQTWKGEKRKKGTKLVACNILNNTVNLLRAKPRGGER